MTNELERHHIKKIIERSVEQTIEISRVVAKNQIVVAQRIHTYVPRDLEEHIMTAISEFYKGQQDAEQNLRDTLRARYL